MHTYGCVGSFGLVYGLSVFCVRTESVRCNFKVSEVGVGSCMFGWKAVMRGCGISI